MSRQQSTRAEIGKDTDEQFIKDLKTSLSPFLNTYSLLKAIPVAYKFVCATESVAAFSGRTQRVGIADNAPDPEEPLLRLSKQGRTSIENLIQKLAQVSITSAEVDDSLRKITEALNKNLDLASKEIPGAQRASSLAQLCIEELVHIERKLDLWLREVIKVRSYHGLTSPQRNGGYSSSPDDGEGNEYRRQRETDIAASITRREGDELVEYMNRLTTRNNLVTQSRLQGLSFAKAFIADSTTKSGYIPIVTVIFETLSSAPSEPFTLGLCSSREIDSRSVRPPETLWAPIRKYNDPGYINAPFLHVVLTFVHGYLFYGPDKGVDWEALREAPTLSVLLEELQVAAGLATTSTSRELTYCWDQLLKVLREIRDILTSHASPSISDVGLDRVTAWRSAVSDSLNLSADLATAGIPSLSINTPAPTSESGPTPKAHRISDLRSADDLNLYRLYAEREFAANSLDGQRLAARGQRVIGHRLSELGAYFNYFKSNDEMKLDFDVLLANGFDTIEYLKFQVSQWRRFLTAVKVMIEIWLRGQAPTEDAQAVLSRIRPSNFMQEMTFVSTHIFRSYFELLSEMTRPFGSLAKMQTDLSLPDHAIQADAESSNAVKAGNLSKDWRPCHSLEDSVNDDLSRLMQGYSAAIQARVRSLDGMISRIEQGGAAIDAKALASVFSGAVSSNNAITKSLDIIIVPNITYRSFT